MEQINIIRKNQGKHVEKENRTVVDYFLFDEYEIHQNVIPAGTTQEWHYHSKVEEVILVTKGTLEVYWIDNDTKMNQTISPGDMVQVKNSIHTFSNESNSDTEFIVFRIVLDGLSKKEIIKNDKRIVEV